MGFGRRVALAFRAFWDLLRSGTLPDDIVAAAARTGCWRRRQLVVAITPAPVERPDDGAVSCCRVLQREGRLVDFLMEDLGTYSDAQIGAAVRDVHANCRRALASAFELEPILEGAEEQADHGAERVRSRVDQAGRPRRRRPDRSAACCGIAGGGRRACSCPRSAPRKRGNRRARRSRSLLTTRKAHALAPRFIVGIDLGTTNCALAAVSADPAERAAARSRCATIPQLVNPARSRRARCCRRSCTCRAKRTSRRAASALPWDRRRRQASSASSRASAARRTRCGSSSSAKSWLSHGGANRSGRDPAVGRAAGGAEGLAGGRVGRVPRHLRRRLERTQSGAPPAKTRTCC